MAFVLPVGVDWADGQTPLPVQPSGSTGNNVIVGTPLPAGQIAVYNGGYNTPQEPPGSPTIERAEQCTCSHTVKVTNSDGIFYLQQMGRGVVVTDSGANIWRILSSSIKTNTEPGYSELTYVMESISFDSPPDDFNINEVQLDINIVKHPRYWWALSPYIDDNSTYTTVNDIEIFYSDIKQSIMRMIQTYIDAPIYPSQETVNGIIQSTILSQMKNGVLQVHYPNAAFPIGSNPVVDPVVWDGKYSDIPSQNCAYFIVNVPVDLTDPDDPISIAIAAATELISKLWRQEDTPYLAGYEVVWTQRFFQPVYLNPGGYIEDPRDWVPTYFIGSNGLTGPIPRGDVDQIPNMDTSPAPGADGETIFDALVNYNPQCYSDDGTTSGNLNFSCLRKADNLNYERTWFSMTHKWLIAPVGKWDSDLYSGEDGPQNAFDFNIYPEGRGNL